MPTVFISAGEPSGDVVGAELVHELRTLGLHDIHAIGGPKLKSTGVPIAADSSSWASIGIVQAALAYPRIKRAIAPLFKQVRIQPPDLFIPIDFGYLNIRLARVAKESGSKVLYYMPPGSWRRTRQGKDLAGVTNKVATPFEWSAKILRENGCDAEWVGHPVMQMASTAEHSERALFALLPGSRQHEIALNIPLIARALSRMTIPGLEPTLIAAPGVTDQAIDRYWPTDFPKPRVWRDGTIGALMRSRAAIVCSGTATLEAAVCDVPHVVIYQVTALMGLAQWYFVRKNIKFIAMPSILLDKPVVPELIARRGTPTLVAESAQRLVADCPERSQQLADFAEVRRLLGPADSISRTATIAAQMLRR